MTQKTDDSAAPTIPSSSIPESLNPAIPAPSAFPFSDADFRALPSSRSTIYARVPHEIRNELDRAIVNYAPPTYRACYQQFGLADLGVKYSAFYLYARKLRAVIDRCRFRYLNRPNEAELRSLLPALAATPTFPGHCPLRPEPNAGRRPLNVEGVPRNALKEPPGPCEHARYVFSIPGRDPMRLHLRADDNTGPQIKRLETCIMIHHRQLHLIEARVLLLVFADPELNTAPLQQWFRLKPISVGKQ